MANDLETLTKRELIEIIEELRHPKPEPPIDPHPLERGGEKLFDSYGLAVDTWSRIPEHLKEEYRLFAMPDGKHKLARRMGP